MSAPPVIVWLRQDLRLHDNPALNAALARGGPVIPLYILDDAGEGRWPMGRASCWWLHHSLAALAASLRAHGLRLILARGDSGRELRRVSGIVGAKAIFWNRRYEPAAIGRDAKLKIGLTTAGLDVRTFNSGLLHEPDTIANKQGRPFQVFTPFWRHCLTRPAGSPIKFPKHVRPRRPPRLATMAFPELELLPRIKWDAGLLVTWQPGEAGGAARLKHFTRHAMSAYSPDRDFPGLAGTSQLSPWLHFGEISPRQVWAAVKSVSRASGVFPPNKGAQVFLNEIGWREFAHHLLVHFPHTPERPLREQFARFPWARDPGGARLAAWQKGQTGYPIVDAGMRQLWRTGWMHNRVRMVVASFLVKHLRLSWTHGAAWFWDTLVDADLANNTLGWQWSAGCGADAAPYFRIFSPVLQSKKFAADGAYLRRWLPELARLPAKYIHAPWEAPETALAAAGVRLGKNYPRPIVDHAVARTSALDAFRSLRAHPDNRHGG